MAQSLSKLNIHIIFHVKSTSCIILKEHRQKLYSYMGAIIKDNASIPIVLNGMSDHVHVLCVMSKNIALAKLVEEIKGKSSKWIKSLDHYYDDFAWQSGYGGFSVSPSLHSKTKQYIENQEQHHLKMSYRKEYRLFLKIYGIEHNEKYLWKD